MADSPGEDTAKAYTQHGKRLSLVSLSLEMLRAGSATFGGGTAMVPLLKRQLVDEAKWIGLEDFQQCIAIAQSFPGSLAVNGCVALGHYLLGWRGAVTAGASVLLPSVLVVLFCAANLPLLQQYRAAVPGLKAAATGLIALGAAVLVAPVLKSWGLVLETAAWLLVLMAFRVPATTMIVSAIILAFVRGASPRRVSRD